MFRGWRYIDDCQPGRGECGGDSSGDRGGVADAQARGINLDIENDDQPSPNPSFWHDAREGDIGIRFLRQQGFGDRI